MQISGKLLPTSGNGQYIYWHPNGILTCVQHIFLILLWFSGPLPCFKFNREIPHICKRLPELLLSNYVLMCPAEHMMCCQCATPPYRPHCGVPAELLHWAIARLTISVVHVFVPVCHNLWPEISVTF